MALGIARESKTCVLTRAKLEKAALVLHVCHITNCISLGHRDRNLGQTYIILIASNNSIEFNMYIHVCIIILYK